MLPLGRIIGASRSYHRAISHVCAAQGRQRLRLTELAHDVWRLGGFVQPGDTVVDATCGNGHDAAFLAQAIGPAGRLVAIDIQPAAIQATKARLEELVPDEDQRPRVDYVLGSHSDIVQHVGSNVASLVCFNTGYLPRSDKSIKTEIDSTIAAVEGSLEALCDGGLVSLLCYTGHDGGLEEYEAIRAFASDLSSAHWKTSEYRLLNSPAAPIFLLISKQ